MAISDRTTTYVVLIAIFLACLGRFIVSPFQIDWDEEVYWWAGKVWFDGGLPYVSIFDHKPAPIYFFNGLFGSNGIEIYRIFFSLATTLAFYLVARQIHSNFRAILATAVFCLFFSLPGGPSGVNTEVVYLLFELASVFFALIGSFFLAALMLSIAINTKYTVIFDAVGIGLFLCFTGIDFKKIIKYSLNVVALSSAIFVSIFVYFKLNDIDYIDLTVLKKPSTLGL